MSKKRNYYNKAVDCLLGNRPLTYVYFNALKYPFSFLFAPLS